MYYTLPTLPYTYNALEPFIDTRTMEIHHTKHNQAYVDKLNAVLQNQEEELNKLSLPVLLRNIRQLPDGIQTAVKNNGGGHYNHSFFWEIMSPQGGGEPQGEIANVLKKHLKILLNLKKCFQKLLWDNLVQDGLG